MWVFLIAMFSGVGAIVGLFALMERLNKRHWERYRREEAERKGLECEVAQRERYTKRKLIREVTRGGMVQASVQDESKK